MKRIAVIGTGYVGLTQTVGLADFGNMVIGVDIDPDKVALLSKGISPIYEHDLQDYLQRNIDAGRLSFTSDVSGVYESVEVVFLALGTPSSPEGETDLSQIRSVIPQLAEALRAYTVIVMKSTVPVGTNRWIEAEIRRFAPTADFDVVSNPEFLHEGRAVYDFFHPTRVVIGTSSARAKEILAELYRPLYLLQTPFLWCDQETAELAKYASNAFLATKIAFINEMANLAERLGADVHVVAQAMGMDERIGPKFLHPGPGFGGSCLPKDIRTLAFMGDRSGIGLPIVKQVMQSNEAQQHLMVQKLERMVRSLQGKRITILGCSFKSETDDVRESPAIIIVQDLLSKGAIVTAHDPKGLDNLKAIFGSEIQYCREEFTALKDADAAIIVTEWNEYRNLDLERVKSCMKTPCLLDTRNVLDIEKIAGLGFLYEGVGRKPTQRHENKA